MSKRWVAAMDVLATYADDLDDERAIEMAERAARAQQRASEVVDRVLADRQRLAAAAVDPVDADVDLEL